MRIDSRFLYDTHRYLFLKKQIVAGFNYCFEIFFQTLKGHIGSSINNDRIFPFLIHINVSHSCWLILEDFPAEIYFSFFHLRLETMHSVVISSLSEEGSGCIEFSGGDCLVCAFAAIGSHIFVGLDGFAFDRDGVDIEKVVSICAPKHTNPFAIHCIQKYNEN